VSTEYVVDIKHQVKEVILPGDPLTIAHRTYLAKRGFDPDELVTKYGIRGTGPSYWYRSHIDTDAEPISLSWRIIIPIHDHNGRLVTWQSRSIEANPKLRYIGCPDTDSIQSYKTLLYGAHLTGVESVGVVEGIFDQWRMGDGWVTCFGTGVTPDQVKALSAWERVSLVFDCETQAQSAARAIGAQLDGLGVRASIVDLEIGTRDCADLSPEEVRLVRDTLNI
jgi:hypothetical protein